MLCLGLGRRVASSLVDFLWMSEGGKGRGNISLEEAAGEGGKREGGRDV